MPDDRASRGLGGTSAVLGTTAGVVGAVNPIAGAALGVGAGLLSIFGALRGRRAAHRAEDRFLATQRGAQQRQAMSMASGQGLTPGATVRAAGSVAGNLEAASAPGVAQMGVARAQADERRRLALFAGLGNALSAAGALGVSAMGTQNAGALQQAGAQQPMSLLNTGDPAVRTGMGPSPHLAQVGAPPEQGQQDALLTLQLLQQLFAQPQEALGPADPLGPMQGPFDQGLPAADQQAILRLLAGFR